MPDNDAIETVKDSGSSPDFDDDATVRDLFEAHLVMGAALTAQEVLDSTSITVVNGGPQPVDASASPATVGGAPLASVDNTVGSSSLVHIVSAVLLPQA